MATNDPSNAISFIPTTYIWDVASLYEIEVTSPEFKEFLIRMAFNSNSILQLLNLKDTGVYITNEIINGQKYFPDPALNSSTPGSPIDRQVYRIVINFGPLPNTSTKSVPHTITITPLTTFTRIYATASDTTGNNYIPIPYASATLSNVIELSVDGTNVNIITNSDRTNYTTCYVVLEYLQS